MSLTTRYQDELLVERYQEQQDRDQREFLIRAEEANIRFYNDRSGENDD